MGDKKEMTAQTASVGADAGQSLTIKNTTIIPESSEEFNGKYEFSETFPDITDPRFLPAISMVELYNTVYQTNPPIIDGLLYPGCYLFVGAPKEGKSFLMLQLGYHVSTGLPLWGYPVRQGTVLYLALEDAFPRLQSRLYRMFPDEATESLYLSTWSKRIGEGLEEQITAFVEAHPDTKLVIIDTLKRVRSTIVNRQAYDEDYDFVSAITDLSQQLGICIMIVHHTRKVKSEKKFDSISGTNGLLGAADGAFLLERDSDRSKTAELSVTGRDQPDMVMKLGKDIDTLQWMLISAEADLWEEPPDPVLEAVSNILSAEAPQWNGTATDLVSLLGLDMKPNQLSVRLNVNAQRLLNDYNIRYSNSRSHAGRRISLQLISSEA